MTDPDPTLTATIGAAIGAIREGGSALANAAGIPDGTKRDFAGGIGNQLDGLGTLTYVGEENVAGRSIRRHGSDVARVRYYRTTLGARTAYLLVHLTANGQIADYDTGDF